MPPMPPRENTVTEKDQIPCVLLVEDDTAGIMVAQTISENCGYRCEVARNGHEALDKFVSGKYCLVLMDVRMSGMDGYETTRRIRALETAMGLPRQAIVAMTACSFLGDKRKCLDAGMDDYIAKPFWPEDLAGLLAKYRAGRPEKPPRAGEKSHQAIFQPLCA